MVRAWGKNNRREIFHTLGRYLAIMGIVALGIGFFAGLKAAKPAMLLTGTKYLESAQMFDARLISTLGMTQADVEYLDGLDYVEAAEGSHQADFLAQCEDKEWALKAISLPQKVNLIEVSAGRMPQNADECLADDLRFSEADIGRTLTITDGSDAFTVKEFTIVGVCKSPLYLNPPRGTTKLRGGALFAFVYAPTEAFLADYFTEIYLRCTDMDTVIYSDAYDARIAELKPQLQAELNTRVELRYADIIDQARQELSKAQADYDEGVAQYEREKAEAEQQLADAAQELDNAAAQIESNRYKLSSGEQALQEARQSLTDGQAEYEAGLAEFEEQKRDAYAQLDAAQAEIDANRATVDAALQQIDDSGVTVQYEALLVTRRQIEQMLSTLTPDTPEYLLYQGMLEAANLLIEQVEASEFFAQYQQLLAAKQQLDEGQAELDTQRAEADAGFAAAQAELDAAKQTLVDAQAQIESSEKEIAAGKVALADAERQLDEGRIAYEESYAQAQEGFAEAERSLADGKRQLDDAQLEVEKIEHPDSYLLGRDTNTGYVSFRNDSGIVEGVAKVFPLFFFLVAAFVCITTMTRMVDEQRTQIGTLKALGYSDGMIAWKYISYSASACLIGCVGGFLLGTWLFPYVIWNAYSMLYHFAPLEYIFDWKMALISLVAAMVCSVGATWFACRNELRQMPASLMRPRAPKAGKRIFLEHIPIIWNRFSFLYKVSLRNIVRYKKRLFMMLIGIGGCTALIATGFGVRDSISNVVDDQFREIMRYDMSVTFSIPMSEERQARFLEAQGGAVKQCVFLGSTTYEVHGADANYTVYIVATDDPAIAELVSLRHDGTLIDYPQSGVVIDERLAEMLNLKVGDSLPISVDDTKTVQAEITGLCENHVQHYAYMTAETYEALFGAPCEIKTAYITAADDVYALSADISGASEVATVSVLDTMRTQVDDMMRSLDYIVLVVILSACALAFIVLYNLCNISITERLREIATVKVLGFYARETQSYVFREVLLLTILGALIGLPFGKLLHGFVMTQISIEMVAFKVRIAPLSYVFSFVITVALALLVDLLLKKKIDRINMAESLKSVE